MSDDVPEWDPENTGAEYQYERFASHLAARIYAGEWNPGARLPPERELADAYAIGYLTVRRGMQVLRERGVVVTRHGRGTFTADPLPAVDADDAPDAIH